MAIKFLGANLPSRKVAEILNIKSHSAIYYWQGHSTDILRSANKPEVCTKLEKLKKEFENVLEYIAQQGVVIELERQQKQSKPKSTDEEKNKLEQQKKRLEKDCAFLEQSEPCRGKAYEKRQNNLFQIMWELDTIDKRLQYIDAQQDDNTLTEQFKIQSAKLDEIKEKCAGMEKYSYVAKSFLSAINQLLDELK